MKHLNTTTRWAGAALALTLSVGALGGCSSSSDKATSSDSSGGATTTVAAGDSTSANSTFCDAWIKVDQVASKGPAESEDAGPDAASLKAFANEMKAPVDAAKSSGPSELAEHLTKISDIVDGVAAGGDPSQFDPSQPALGDQLTAVEKWVHDNCGFNTLDLMGVDYAFQDAPKTAKAGTTSVQLTNMATDEPHELALFRLKDDATATADEITAAIEKNPNAAQAKYESQIEMRGVVDAGPGATNYTLLDLEPGTYIGACFLPVTGSTTGELHVQKGMVTSFTVS